MGQQTFSITFFFCTEKKSLEMRSLELSQKPGSEYALLCYACLLDTWVEYLVQVRKNIFKTSWILFFFVIFDLFKYQLAFWEAIWENSIEAKSEFASPRPPFLIVIPCFKQEFDNGFNKDWKVKV